MLEEQDFIFLLQRSKQGHLSAQPEHPCSAGQKVSPGWRGRGKQQEPLEVGGKGILLGVFSRFLFVSASARGCWRLLVPTSWCLWPQHSSGSVQCGKMPRSEPSLLAAPIEAEAVGAGATLQPAARQEASQGGAGAEVAAAAKVEALSAWPAPWAPGHLDGATGKSISVVPPETPGFPGCLPWIPSLYLLMSMGSIPIGVWGLPRHLEETSDQAAAWPAALQVPQGVGRCRA